MKSWQHMVLLAQNVIPKLKIRYKEDKWYWRILPDATEKAATTTGADIWLSSREWAQEDEMRTLDVVLHEIKHAEDWQENPVKFLLGYVMPQILGVLPVVIGIILAVKLHWLWCLMSIFSAGAFAAWPSPWRLNREKPAYKVGIWFCNYVNSLAPGFIGPDFFKIRMADLTKAFLGRVYYRMTWRKRVARKAAYEVVSYMYDHPASPPYKDKALRVHAVTVTTQAAQAWKNGSI